MGNTKEKETITVEALLRIKRCERPDGEFWDSFENDFHRRRLNELVERRSFREIVFGPSFKALSLGLPAVLIAGLAFIWSPVREFGEFTSTSTGESSDSSSFEVAAADRETGLTATTGLPLDGVLATNEGPISSQFVVDALRSDAADSTLNFRKVLYTPAIHLSAPSGSFYVKDSLTSRNYKATTADLKLGRNF